MAELKERYAAALLSLSLERGKLDEGIEQALIIREVLQNEQAESFLIHPGIPSSAKRNFLTQLFAGKISDDLMGFLYLAVKKSREALILPVLETYIDLGRRRQGKVSATVVSAAELREEQLSALSALLSRKLDKQVELSARVDPAVIGGLYIHLEGRLIDHTVRTQLKNMKEIVRRGVSNDCKAR